MRIIAGNYKRRKIYLPKSNTRGEQFSIRPTSDRARETLFDILNNIAEFESSVCLDLFAGTGSLGFECLSRGAASCDFVDISGKNLMSIKRTAEELGCLNQISVIKKKAVTFLNDIEDSKFSFVFADPPYTYRRYPELTQLVLNLKPEIFVLETSAGYSLGFEQKNYILKKRQVGSAGFHIFQISK
jgi:16S rRNA (guanine966-N2)-methyltransferase